MILTDAAFETESGTGGLGGVLLTGSGSALSFFSVPISEQQAKSTSLQDEHTIIYELEMFGVLIGLKLLVEKTAAFAESYEQPGAVAGTGVICYIDNDAARHAYVAGSSKKGVAGILIDEVNFLEYVHGFKDESVEATKVVLSIVKRVSLATVSGKPPRAAARSRGRDHVEESRRRKKADKEATGVEEAARKKEAEPARPEHIAEVVHRLDRNTDKQDVEFATKEPEALDQAEIDEITHLQAMNVLVEPVGAEEAEHLSSMVQYRWATDMLEENTFSPASVNTLARLVPLLSHKWGTLIYVMDVKDDSVVVPPAGKRPCGGQVGVPASGKVDVDDMMATGDEFEFLKRRYVIQPRCAFTLTCSDLAERPKERQTPGLSGQDDMFAVDTTKLPAAEATKFRTMLYVSNERPDAQAVIQSLSSRAARPTERAMKLMKHLVGYLWKTQGYGVNLRLAPEKSVMRLARGKLLLRLQLLQRPGETCKSLSSGQVYLDQTLMYSFVRGQKVVTLSSGEAELVATSEAILIHKAWQWSMREDAELVMRSDSLVARAIASRLGVGRVRHLQTTAACGYSSGWPASFYGSPRCRPSSTQVTSKSLQQRRLRLLCFLAGVVDDNGEPIGQAEHAEAMGHEAMAAITMQGCTANGTDTTETLEAILFYMVETFYANPMVMVLLVVIYMLVTSRWSFTLTAATSETLTYEDLFENGGTPGLEPATGSYQEATASAAASCSTSVIGSLATRAQQRLTLAEQRRGFLECALEHLSDRELEETVWTTTSGCAYHRRTCGNIRNSSKVGSRVAREAIRLGKAACNQCYADHFCPTVRKRFPGQGL
ncbi:unnamed protein product [Symbiodinium sp. CCMP2592]|nr:unnamed protein product [Symbiodinium sp. CCMP2592]